MVLQHQPQYPSTDVYTQHGVYRQWNAISPFKRNSVICASVDETLEHRAK